MTNSFTATDSQKAGTHTWLTPKYFFEKLGNFDLDPCSAPLPRPFPTAETMYSESECDGLSKKWFGRVWLNPPYGKWTQIWLNRLAEHGDGIALVFARTDTKWFQEIASKTGIYFLKGRITFLLPNGEAAKDRPSTPSCLIPFGAHNVGSILSSGLPGVWKQ